MLNEEFGYKLTGTTIFGTNSPLFTLCSTGVMQCTWVTTGVWPKGTFFTTPLSQEGSIWDQKVSGFVYTGNFELLDCSIIL